MKVVVPVEIIGTSIIPDGGYISAGGRLTDGGCVTILVA